MNAEQIRNSWDDDHDVTQPCAFPEPLAEVLTRENRELRATLADATTAAQNLRDELQGAQERLRRVRELADEWEQASGLRSGFSLSDLEKASWSERTLWEVSGDLRSLLDETPESVAGRRERLAECLYRLNGSALYGNDLGPFDGDRMESEQWRWLQQADAALAVLATSPAALDAGT